MKCGYFASSVGVSGNLQQSSGVKADDLNNLAWLKSNGFLSP
jgi:hypothetical protein